MYCCPSHIIVYLHFPVSAIRKEHICPFPDTSRRSWASVSHQLVTDWPSMWFRKTPQETILEFAFSCRVSAFSIGYFGFYSLYGCHPSTQQSTEAAASAMASAISPRLEAKSHSDITDRTVTMEAVGCSIFECRLLGRTGDLVALQTGDGTERQFYLSHMKPAALLKTMDKAHKALSTTITIA